jgi:hypothetical protein
VFDGAESGGFDDLGALMLLPHFRERHKLLTMGVGGLFVILAMIFWLWAIFDSITADDTRIRIMPKVLWVIVVLLFFEFGALAWVAFGRPRKASSSGPRSGGTGGFGAGGFGRGGLGRGGLGRGGPGSGRPLGGLRAGGTGPVGPDDDPDFLRTI